ncbi:FRG domain-containing protein [Actinomyces sp.]
MNTQANKNNSAHKETEEERRMRDERFVEKFFTERELIVNFDDTSESDEENAQAWYEAVEKTISALPIYQHDNMGRPLNITDATNADSADSDKAGHTDPDEVDNKSSTSKTKSQAWFFRGQKDAKFGFTSTLYRRVLNSNHSKLPTVNPQNLSLNEQIMQDSEEELTLEKSMIKTEDNLLKKVREIGIGRGLTNLETLTLLQHHGSPTRLIDVTSDWKVALFFACEGDDDRDGRIFLINTTVTRWKNFPKERSPEKRSEKLIWQDLIERSRDLNTFLEDLPFVSLWHTTTWPILLPFSDPRMISQRGFFLTGGIPPRRFATTLQATTHLVKENRRKCSDSKTTAHSMTYSKEASISVKSSPTPHEFRMITSLPILFRKDKKFLEDLAKLREPLLRSAGYSIRVPKHFKRKLREILRNIGVHTDSMYPPLRETVRLFEHVVDESLK